MVLIDIDECALNLHNCNYACLNTEGSYLCTCPSGFRVLFESGACIGTRHTYKYILYLLLLIDINECSSGIDGCSHICHNTNGSYTCSCPRGMLLSNDSKNCSSMYKIILYKNILSFF